MNDADILCITMVKCNNKHLMTGPEGNIEIRGKQNSLFPKGPVIK